VVPEAIFLHHIEIRRARNVVALPAFLGFDIKPN